MSIEWLLVKNKDTDKQKGKPDKESPNEVKLHCHCGLEGMFSINRTDFEFLGEDKKGYAYFVCTNCTRHLRYDISTGKIKIKKGAFGFVSSRL